MELNPIACLCLVKMTDLTPRRTAKRPRLAFFQIIVHVLQVQWWLPLASDCVSL